MALGESQTGALAPTARGEFSAGLPAPPSWRAGRDGLLRLGFERRGDATFLRHCRYTLPLQVLSPLALDDGSSYLLLLNPTGGVLGGDHLRTEITLGENAHACISTPSATRVYRTNSVPAEIHTHLRIGLNATIEYLPDHVIPHPGSSLRQSLRIEMDEGSRGVFFDGFSSGRVALGEAWQFRDFDSRTELFLRGQPIFANRTKLSPKANDLAAFGRMGGCAYCGSLLIIGDGFENWLALIDAMRAALDAMSGMLGGASLLGQNGCSVRYLAHSAIDFHAATQNLWAIARQHLLNLPPFALRKY
ncbi:MAG TPA: urease accessory protein UreD [Candidatus Acidoferrales bacterium]|jgi:urease accessory protein|nr:urease accessory protein UreD [Candidatus Acidoferrales bacterium]